MAHSLRPEKLYSPGISELFSDWLKFAAELELGTLRREFFTSFY